MDLRFYLSIFLRRLPWFLLFLVLGTAAGITLARVLPAVHAAEALLVVESQQIPDALAASTVDTPAVEQLQIIQQRILAREQLLEMANRLQIYAIPGEAARPQDADEIVADLRARIAITTTGGDARGPIQATLVRVRFEAPAAVMAATVANEIVTLILREDVAMRTGVARQTLDFFEQEVRRLDQELARKGAEVLRFKEENSTALPDSLDFRRSQQAAAQERLLQFDRQEAELTERRSQLEQLAEAAGQGNLPAGATLTPEQQNLQALQDQLVAQLAVLSPTHPAIRMLQAQVSAAEQAVARQMSSGTEEDPGRPPILTAFDLQLADLDSQLNFIATSRVQIAAELDALSASIAATPANAIALGTLERDYANLQTQYDDAVAKRAAAETGDVIEALAKGQRISVIEQAVAPTEPERPNRLLIAGGGIGLGFALGLGIVVLLELMKPGIRRPVEIVNRLGITPFATLPYIRTRTEILRRRLILGGVFAAVAVGVPAALWVVHTQYMPLDLLLRQLADRAGLAALPAILPVG